ncbi:hypothetical protein [Nostoc sp. DSM 114159]
MNHDLQKGRYLSLLKLRLVVNISYVAIAPTQSYRQFSLKMLLLSEFLGTIGLSDDTLAACLPRK